MNDEVMQFSLKCVKRNLKPVHIKSELPWSTYNHFYITTILPYSEPDGWNLLAFF